jgi:hypothetical protein
MTRICSWIAAKKRHTPTESTREAQRHLDRLQAQQPEVDQLSKDAIVSLDNNHFRMRVEAALRGVDLP